jgi:hypothetical protein
MSNTNDQLIDICVDYIINKDCHYIAKEGQIVYYMSITGRKTDYMWHKMTILEILRVIKAMKLSMDQAGKLKEGHLIAAFQELGRVYEFGVKSRHVTKTGIFNYSQHSEMSVGDEAMSMLVESLQMNGLTAVLLSPVTRIFNKIQEKLHIKLTPTEQRDLLYKHFEGAGYVIKTGSRRPLIDGKKKPAIMMPNTKPSEVVDIPLDLGSKFIVKIYGELI